jgi:hypothetical protein
VNSFIYCYSMSMKAKSMEKRQRVILYGRSVILGTVGSSLQKRPQFEVISLTAPYPGVQELGAMKPDVILFDTDTPRPAAAFALLATCPGLQLIGIDPDRDQVSLWSGQNLRELSVQDLVEVIRGGRDGEGETQRRGDTVNPERTQGRR